MQKVEPGPGKKKKVPALAQLFQPLTNCNPQIEGQVEILMCGVARKRGLLLSLLTGQISDAESGVAGLMTI
jgi:hypothetical protein